MTSFPQQPGDLEPTLPQGLLRDLRLLDAGLPAVPSELDAEIMAAAANRLSRPQGLVITHARRFTPRRVAAALSMAAGLALAVWAGFGYLGSSRHSVTSPAILASGTSKKLGAPGADPDWLVEVRAGRRATIVDAFALACLLRDGGGLSPGYDINGDGHIDQSDVDELARQAVRLTAGNSTSEGHG